MTALELLATEWPTGTDTPVLVEYLDLDHDGVPDAVHIRHAFALDRSGDGNPDSVELVDEFAASIGIDGVPRRVEVVPIT